MTDNKRKDLLEVRREMWTFFENFPITGFSDEDQEALEGDAYLTTGTFTMAIGYNM